VRQIVDGLEYLGLECTAEDLLLLQPQSGVRQQKFSKFVVVVL
jgi:hypothetical protein